MTLRWPDPWLHPINLHNAPEQGRVESYMTYEERKSSEVARDASVVAEVLHRAICDLESEFDPCHPIIERLEEMYRYYTEEQQHDL